jgi:diguanylate cyclase (GGDEF)-like protein/PAS domain S-box-containing protein
VHEQLSGYPGLDVPSDDQAVDTGWFADALFNGHDEHEQDAAAPAPSPPPPLTIEPLAASTEDPGIAALVLDLAACFVRDPDAGAALAEAVTLLGGRLGLDRVTLFNVGQGVDSTVKVEASWTGDRVATDPFPASTWLDPLLAGELAAHSDGERWVAAAGVWADGTLLGALVVEGNGDDRRQAAIEAIPVVTGAIGAGLARVASDAGLRRTAEHYRQLVEEATDAIYTTDLQGHIEWTNAAMQEMLAVEPGSVAGMHLTQVLAPEYQRAFADAMESIVVGQEPVASLDIEMVAFDGSRHALGLTIRVGHNDGTPAHIHGIGRNITARKQAEALFRTVARDSKVGLYIANGGCYTFVNPQFAAFTGYSADELIGRPTTDLVAGSDRERVRRTADVQLRSGRGNAFEYAIIHRSGEQRWLLETVTPVDYNGERAALGNVIDITERKQAEDRLSYQAWHDDLTGLLNRARFVQRLEQELTPPPPGTGVDTPGVGVLYIDLDGFKAVNDSWGHQVGDRLLALVAQRLRDSVRPTDEVARLGGDEFTVLLRGVNDLDSAGRAAGRIIDAIREPFAVAGRSVSIGARVGVACGIAGDIEALDLLAAADDALYRAKAGGKSGVASADGSVFRVA